MVEDTAGRVHQTAGVHQADTMRKRYAHLRPVVTYLGALSWFFSAVVLLPIPVALWYGDAGSASFVATSAAFALLGLAFKSGRPFEPLSEKQAMVLCSVGWILVSVVSAIPLWWVLGCPYLDGVVEAVSGFTTTGITMLNGLDGMPRGVLFWRALMQWLGGLGILSFFMLVLFAGGTAHRIISAEAHKIASQRANPSVWSTLRILWLIYGGMTGICMLVLMAEGLSPYDAVYHAFTGLSTGGFSPYDASIGHYREAGYANWRLIEYTIILFMVLGGMNFIVHYRVLTGGIKTLWANYEIRLWWCLLLGAAGLVLLSRVLQHGFGGEDSFRTSLFHAVSIATGTGYVTRDIGGAFFGALAQQVFLVLMVIGGCVGSTTGGMKVLRIGILLQSLKYQMRRTIFRRSATNLVVIDGEIVEVEEIRRVAALFFSWILLLVIGGMVTAAFSSHGAFPAFSGAFSALGNIGPCYIPGPQMAELHPVVKIVYILEMLAGRLEILPLLILFSPRTWK